ncbi:MAG: glycosyltransferase [Verrucomicrobiota bacterium]|nr:glycosyltransferase [Verrucomicrobiota bacterium]
MTPTEPSVLLLIPAYNEEKRIEPVLRDYAQYFRAHYKGRFTMVVVLNGCRDDTLGVVQRCAGEFPEIQSLEFQAAIGKGGALIEGLKLAPQADLIGYVDADGATAPPAFHDLIRHCRDVDCVIGSRWLPGSVLHQSQSAKRRIFSRIFHLIVELLFRMRIKDTQCGAKVMRREAIEKIHSALRIADVAFDINLLYSLKRNGFTVKEVPTVWTDQIGSKIQLNKGALGILLSVFRLRLIYSPFYGILRPLRPVEAWIYKKLRAPQPLPGPDSK